ISQRRVHPCIHSDFPLCLAADKAQHKPALPVRRARANLRPGCLERHTLSDIQNAVRVGEEAAGVRKASVTGESLQRREKHNSMERDRRRRIRICCDELNKLVPFCSFDTDKATTLQWTTAFLKYLKEIYGDSLKQVCGPWGKSHMQIFGNRLGCQGMGKK
uniref:BHLH domain-containing protein n=1 Tax=Paramormyrops kingsleyae TaxID=1676925 RepID=A0A3B3RZF6_9TELE